MATGKILIVDDDTNICELLRLYIEKEGYEASIANDGETALQVFDTFHPDLILLDIMLPGLDGWQVCREIRKKSSCPIIMLTAKGEVFDKVLGLELGADDYVVKPFETKEVIARIGAVLRRSGKQGEDKNESKEGWARGLSSHDSLRSVKCRKAPGGVGVRQLRAGGVRL